MSARDFSSIVERIVAHDPRYDKGAYHFIRQALDYTLKQPDKSAEGDQGKHVSGVQLLDGIRDFTLEQYGPLSLTLLQAWGFSRCEDFGEVVFNLVDYGVLGKTENDRREDFANGYDFDSAFAAPFRPTARKRLPGMRIPVESEAELDSSVRSN